MSHHEVYDILGLLLQGQDSGVQLLEFSTREIHNSDVDAISELPQSPGTHREPPTTSSRDVGTGNAAAELENEISEISDSPRLPESMVSSQPCDADKGNYSPLSLLSSGTCTASPVIEPPS